MTKKERREVKKIDTKKLSKINAQVEKSIKLLTNIAEKTAVILSRSESHLYGKLRETYILYFKWMNSPNKQDFFDEVELYLSSKNIPYQANTSEALLMTKAILGEKNKSKASKYAKHMEVAFRNGITDKEYPAWMQENGVEAISRKSSRIKKPKKIKIDEKSNYERAANLILKWLEIREANPITTGKANIGSIAKYDVLKNESNTNTVYELAICNRRPAGDDTNQQIIDTLWLLPKTVTIENQFLHYLAHAIIHDLPNLELQLKGEELKVFGTEIEQLISEDEIYQFAYEEDARELTRKVDEARVQGMDVGSVYSTHKFKKPKITRPEPNPVKKLFDKNIKQRSELKSNELLKAVALEGFIKDLENQKNVPNAKLKKYLTEDEFGQIESQTLFYKDVINSLKDKPEEIIEYEKLLKKAILQTSLRDRSTGKKAYKHDALADSYGDDALQFIIDCVLENPSLARWLDREVDDKAGSNIGVSVEELPRVIGSKSRYTRSNQIGSASVIQKKLTAVKLAYSKLFHKANVGSNESDESMLSKLLNKSDDD